MQFLFFGFFAQPWKVPFAFGTSDWLAGCCIPI